MKETAVEKSDIKKAIIRSQHCQRNWDLTKKIPSEDIKMIETAVTNCPSKQNVAYYKAVFVTDRDKIERIYKTTNGFVSNFQTNETVTNSQVLANLLVVFAESDTEPKENIFGDVFVPSKDLEKPEDLLKDKHMAIGIGAGYANITASMLGYSTGCCACFDPAQVAEILGIDNHVHLLMGIGFKDETRPRREHHAEDFVFPTKKKQHIQVDKC
jgi:nitroreductase